MESFLFLQPAYSMWTAIVILDPDYFVFLLSFFHFIFLLVSYMATFKENGTCYVQHPFTQWIFFLQNKHPTFPQWYLIAHGFLYPMLVPLEVQYSAKDLEMKEINGWTLDYVCNTPPLLLVCKLLKDWSLSWLSNIQCRLEGYKRKIRLPVTSYFF